MAGYQVKNYLLNGAAQSVGASATAQAVTPTFTITAGDSKNLLVKVVASGVTSTTGITAKLQDSFDGGTTWEDAGEVDITTDGNFEIEHDAGEATTGVLWNLGRVVATTGTGDAVTVDAVYVSRRL